MDEYRSKSYGDGRMEIDNYYGPSSNNNKSNNGVGFQDLRCYSASYATSARTTGFDPDPKELRKTKTGKATSSSSSTAWCFSDPELQRKKRVASYKSYTVEAKLKRSFSKSFRWIKHRYTNIVNGS